MLLHYFIECPEVLNVSREAVHLGRHNYVDLSLLNNINQFLKAGSVGVAARTQVFDCRDILPAVGFLAGYVGFADLFLTVKRRILYPPVLVFSGKARVDVAAFHFAIIGVQGRFPRLDLTLSSISFSTQS